MGLVAKVFMWSCVGTEQRSCYISVPFLHAECVGGSIVENVQNDMLMLSLGNIWIWSSNSVMFKHLCLATHTNLPP